MSESQNLIKGQPNSLFPNSIDPILFIQDMKLSDKEYRQNYASNLTLYPSTAAYMLETNDYYTPISASLVNTLILRTYSLQDYLLNGTGKKKFIEASTEEPTQVFEGKLWYYIEE